MDRPTIRTEADARTPGGGLPGDFLPDSRLDLIARGQMALGAGPVLVTGDAGVGKTWLVERWVESASSCRWVTVDLTPDDPATLLYRQLARGLGLAVSVATPATRADIAEALAERTLDGERFGLIVDEAHNLGASLWEEVRLLHNRLGRDDGFAHLILVGQTPLVRRFTSRSLGGVEARLAAHLHLRPLDLADTHAWLAAAEPNRPWGMAEVETFHRDSGGNPARLRRRWASLGTRARATPTATAAPAASLVSLPTESNANSVLAVDSTPPGVVGLTPATAPLTGPARPPLHVEENAIEVGWSGDDGAPTDGAPAGNEAPSVDAVRLDETDQAVHDHYAALQAWREWADNQTHRTPSGPPRTDRELADEIDHAAEAEAAEFFNHPRLPRSATRTETHGSEPFAPFGALFARLPRGVDAESPRS